MALQPFVGPWPLFSFLILYTVCRTPWTVDQPVSRPLPTHRTTQTQNKRTQTSMPLVGFEPTIPAFEREKTVHALDRAATVIGPRRDLCSFYFKHWLMKITNNSVRTEYLVFMSEFLGVSWSVECLHKSEKTE
jgi:hypothetical protein